MECLTRAIDQSKELMKKGATLRNSAKVIALFLAASVVVGAPISTANATEPVRSGQLVNLYKSGSFTDGSTAFAWTDNIIGSASSTDLNASFACPEASTSGWVFVASAGNETTKTNWQAYAKQSFVSGTKNLLTPNLKLSGLANGTVSTVKALGGSWSLGIACTENQDTTVDYVAFRRVSVAQSTGAWTSAGELVLTPAPLLSGTYMVGNSIVAQPGSWDLGVALTYQWLRDGSAINGAIDASYILQPADAGHQVSVRVTGRVDAYPSASTQSSPESVIAAPLGTTAVPTISGTAVAGSTLSAVPGVWSDGVSFSYQWKRDGSNLSGATSASYVAQAADVNHTLSVSVTGSLIGFESATQTSASTSAVANATFGSLTVAIVGTTKATKTVSAKVVGARSGATLKYQWLLDGKVISKATAATLKITAKQKGHKLSVRVTQTKAGFTTVVKVSAAKKIA